MRTSAFATYIVFIYYLKFILTCNIEQGFPRGSVVKNVIAIQETWVRSLGQEDSLEMKMTTHSSILDQRIPWTEEPGRLQSIGLQRVGQD